MLHSKIISYLNLYLNAYSILIAFLCQMARTAAMVPTCWTCRAPGILRRLLIEFIKMSYGPRTTEPQTADSSVPKVFQQLKSLGTLCISISIVIACQYMSLHVNCHVNHVELW